MAFAEENDAFKQNGISGRPVLQSVGTTGHFNGNKKQILLLHSYNVDFDWVQNVEAGVRSVFSDSSGVEFCYAYMDAKRVSNPDVWRILHEYYQARFAGEKFDAIIASDDDAYRFLLTYQELLFPNTPVVFCGVNSFSNSDLRGHPDFTGVLEIVDVRNTLDLALKLHPRIRQIVVINDKTPVGVANKKLIEELIPEFYDRVRFTFLEDLTMPEVQENVARLDEGSLILLMTFNRDKAGNRFSYKDSIQLIAGKAKVPIYGIWDFYLGHGMLGGMVTTGYAQGEMAAGLVKRIFAGEKPGNIPVVKESPNRYMFDYRQLVKFGIGVNDVPAGSVVVNKPFNFYERYWMMVWGVAFFILLLLVVVMALYVNIKQRQKVEEQLKVYATTDGMTGVMNRRTGLLFLEEQMALAERMDKELTICFVDVNDLKKVNDCYGHSEGDRLIKTVSRFMKESLRKSDILCRFGGDEFLMIFPGCRAEEAELLWNRIYDKILRFNAAVDWPFSIGISHGLAEYNPAEPQSPEQLIQLADYAMYQEKNSLKGTWKGMDGK